MAHARSQCLSIREQSTIDVKLHFIRDEVANSPVKTQRASTRTEALSGDRKPPGTGWQASQVTGQTCQNSWPHNESKTWPGDHSSDFFSKHGQSYP
ncbi:hypothetical protein CUMW_265340 [Citrus unshiu]|uniref:Uncharacterized protein n=1 Tax=Citrus unshiu TaxID=55188 RepID=A0A2H5QVE0_CITUN|nr:hypothetical protein CUMW_265340 [Citrus unshiu]